MMVQTRSGVLSWCDDLAWRAMDVAARVCRSGLRAVLVWLLCAGPVLAGRADAQDTPDFFRQNCTNCHTIGGGRLTGPDLKNVTQQKDRSWLIEFMVNPRAMIASGDPYAAKIFQEARQVPMPTLPGMNRERAAKLLDLIEAESKLKESHFKGLQISQRPFTDDDRAQGYAMFVGLHRLEAGGPPCISCHSIEGLSALGGGRLGPDLTKVFERLKGRKALSAWLAAPGTETMQPVFKDHPLKADEILAVVAYFKSVAAKPESDAAPARMAFLLLGLAGATALVFVFDAVWKQRFHAVRRPLVEKAERGRQ